MNEITREQFTEIISPLVMRFKTPPNFLEILDIDYQNLKYFEPDLLKSAVQYILENRRYQEYPALAEIIDAIESVRERFSEPELKDWACSGCLDSGIYYNPITYKAYFCSCEKGIRKRAYITEFFKSRDIKKAREAMAKADVSEAKPGPEIYEKRGGYRIIKPEYDEKIIRKLKLTLERLKRDKKQKTEVSNGTP